MKLKRTGIRLILLFLLAIELCILPTWIVPAPAVEPPSLEQQSRSRYEAGQYQDAIAPLQQAIQLYELQGDRLRQAIGLGNLALLYRQLSNWSAANEAIAQSLLLLQPEAPASVLAQILDIQAQLQLAQGQTQQAIDTWERATRLSEGGDRSSRIRIQINQAQALQELGLYRRSIALLTDLSQQLPPDSQGQAIVRHRLADALIVAGDLQQARSLLESLPIENSDLHLSWGNLLRAEAIAHLNFENLLPTEAVSLLQANPSARRPQIEAARQFMQETQSAIDHYQQAAIEATAPEIRVQAQLNLLSLLIETGRREAAETLVTELLDQPELPITHASLFDRIGLAQSAIALAPSRITPLQIAQLLQTTHQQAIALQDRRAQSFALGTLGGLYEQSQQWAEARSLTEQALTLVQADNAADIAYRWQWQIGRLLKAQGDRSGAIEAYSKAVNSLQLLRRDLVAMNRDVQFSFREGVEPVYRQLADLLLRSNSDATELQQARSAIEGLQIAELDNFFREACLDTAFQLDRVVDQAARPSAIFYTITLGDRLEVILKLPGQNLIHYTASVPQPEVEATVDALLIELKRPFSTLR